MVRQFERGHLDDDDDDHHDQHHDRLYKEFVNKHREDFDDETDPLEDSPSKGRETAEEKKEKLLARGSKQTEK